MENKSIGSIIREYRKQKNITQKDLAEMLGISQSAISSLERTGDNLRADTAKKVAAALDIDYRELFPPIDLTRGKAPDETIAHFNHAIEQSNQLETDLVLFEQIQTHFGKLNASGKTEAVKRVEELTMIPRYQAGSDPDPEEQQHDHSVLDPEEQQQQDRSVPDLKEQQHDLPVSDPEEQEQAAAAPDLLEEE